METNRLLLIVALFTPWVAGCGGSSASSTTTFQDSNDPAYAAAQDGHMDPRVSTSGGEPGGYVVLWPRIVPADPNGEMTETASMIQNRLIAFAQESAAGHPVDVRPDPQRVCPRAGCAAASVGAAILHARGSCAVVVTTSAPGTGRAHIDPWAGRIDVLNADPPFRDPPEEHVRVRDFVPCAELAASLDENAEGVLLNVRAARRGP